MTIFQRTPNYVAPKKDRVYGPLSRGCSPASGRLELLYRWWIYWTLEARWLWFRKDSWASRTFSQLFAKAIRQRVVSDGLPGLGRRARLPHRVQADPHLERLVPDADATERERSSHPPIDHVEPDAVVTADGARHPADVLVFATGFATTRFLEHIPVRGQAGRLLADEWQRRRPRLSRHDGRRLPQLLPALRPQHQPRPQLDPLHGRAPGEPDPAGPRPADRVDHCEDSPTAARGCRPGRLPRDDTRTQRRLAGTAWVAGCRSWYKDAAGRVVNNWPTWTVRYWYETLRLGRPRSVDRGDRADDARVG